MAQRTGVAASRRGEVYLVSFAGPALIIQNDVANRWSPVTIVAAITSRPDAPVSPADVPVDPPEGSLSAPSLILLNQIRTIDRRRLVKRLGRLRPDTMRLVDRALQISLGLAGI